jgi:glycine/D-amino acid oxidase-like deaminating enzyme
LDSAQLAARFDWLHCADLLAANLGTAQEGWFDGYALARALAAKAVDLGAKPLRARVVGADWQGGGAAPGGPAGQTGRGRLQALHLSDGQRLAADAFVLAAGAWSGHVGRALGVPVPVAARKRTVFMLTCPTPLPRTPLVVDPSGVWFRSEGAGFLAGWSPGAHDPDADDLPLDQPDLAQFEERLWPALAQRVPAFQALRVQRAWDGYYEVHPLDHNGLVGPHPDAPNLVLACGFSGHGLQHAPGVGRGVAEWLLHGRYSSITLAPLAATRLRSGQALVEQAII